MSAPTLLVVAKSPVAGQAKTRLTTLLTPEQAADLAAASLLDTLDAVHATPAQRRVVAFTGNLGSAARHAELRRALRTLAVVPQRGTDLAQRLATAHLDAAEAAHTGGVLQIGMDTPQVSPALLTDAALRLTNVGTDAVLGPAADGGWWALGLRRPEWARALTRVPMSSADTGEQTLRALREAGARVQLLEELRDVDTPEDIAPVVALAPHTRFAHAAVGMDVPATSQ